MSPSSNVTPLPWNRPQGYRLHLHADALNAAHEVLTREIRAVFDATAYRTEPFTTVLGTNLRVIDRIATDAEHDTGHDSPGHANVDRATLRQLLLAGLDSLVHFGKRLERYESTPAGVTAHFSDGTSAQGDVLVGADGIRSAVRHQRAAECETVDAGITAIYGRLQLDIARALVPAETLSDIFTIASDDRKVFLGLGTVDFPAEPAAGAEQFAPGITMRDEDDYVVCIVGGFHEYFPSEAELRETTSEQLRSIAAGTIGQWPGQARQAVQAADPAAFFLVEMYTSVPCELGAPANVTLLGDAIHAMTPTLGRGANVAMRDGALLGRALRGVANGTMTLPRTLVTYERNMLDYGFTVVREAAVIGQQRMNQNPLPA